MIIITGSAPTAIAWMLLVWNSFHLIACQYLKTMMILLRLLQHMCLHGQKIFQRIASTILNAIKASGVELGSRQKYIFCVDTTNISSFNMNVVNTTKICTLALLNFLGHSRKFWENYFHNWHCSLRKSPWKHQEEACLPTWWLHCMIISRLWYPWVRYVKCNSSMMLSKTLSWQQWWHHVPPLNNGTRPSYIIIAQV